MEQGSQIDSSRTISEDTKAYNYGHGHGAGTEYQRRRLTDRIDIIRFDAGGMMD